jgi:hypothetical protein
VTGVAAPAWAEHAAVRRIDAALTDCDGECEAPSIDIDLGGLSVRGAAVESARLRGRAELVRVEPRLDGLHVRVRGLDAQVSARTPSADEPAPAPAPTSTSSRTTTRPRLEHPLPGVPIHVEVEGTIGVEGPRGTELIAIDPRIELTATGEVDVQLSGRILREEAVLARARHVTVSAPDLGASEWTMSADVDLGAGHRLPVAGRISREGATVRAVTSEGRLDAVVEWSERERMSIDAERFALGFLPHLSVHDEELGADFGQGLLDGTLELTRDASGEADVRIEDLRVSGLVIEAAPLSKEPMYMREIGLDGQLHLSADEVSGALELRHGDLVSLVSGHVNRSGVEVGLALEPLPCQVLLDSMPTGFVPTLEGMQLDGEMSASANVRFDFDDLARSRAREVEAAEEVEPPGEIDLEFPFLERCEVVRDAPGIDLEALAGNYRHRFLTAGGTEQTRILAGGADGFVTIAAAPDLARAFVILEDARFWHHDGFDREQIERAFWHNLGVEGFSRGASTITQQTARNLWLGHERTLGRKLQEALLTARLERELDKRRILEIYMNIIELGPEVHGVADAARYHFGRAPHELNTLQALHLASLAPAPVTYSRRFAGGQVTAQWREHLEAQVERLRIHGFVSRIGAEQAKRMPLDLLVRDL